MSRSSGAIPYQTIREMTGAGYFANVDPELIQPASSDLSITDEIYRMRGSYLPRQGEPIRDIIAHGALYRHSLERPLEHNGIYLIRLAQTLQLPPIIRATVSNKSSSGRLNLRGRLLSDGVPRFDDVPAGYHGSLWQELIPKSFPILLHFGDRLNQIRFFHGDARLNALEHRLTFDRYGLLRQADGTRIPSHVERVGQGITMTVDLSSSDIIGWRAKQPAWHMLDTARYDHDPQDFFEPVARPKNDELYLSPGTFYILNTKEKVVVPPHLAAEMAAYDPSKGEFRSHFAGFFDPAFGWSETEIERGSCAVLEVEAHGHDFILRDGQPICLMVFERLLATPEKLYGSQELASHYQKQTGPRLAKWFRTV